MLSPDQRQQLLTIARRSIEMVLSGRRTELDPVTDPELRRPSGVFVSLHTHDGDLRGCIGSIEPVAPLWEAVARSAVNAAFRDPRFHPLQPDELPSIELEVSVMSPITPVSNVLEIEVGVHGLIVRRGNRAGLLLPQVPLQFGWDRETFLRQTCVKAGLPPDSWRTEEVRLEKFSAEVFAEQ
jgi:AmmeMemoRadiSam system protein A